MVGEWGWGLGLIIEITEGEFEGVRCKICKEVISVKMVFWQRGEFPKEQFSQSTLTCNLV